MDVFDKDIIDAFKDTLNKAKKIVVIGHKNVDGDCLGSTLSISKFFEKRGVETIVIIPNEIPGTFNWLKATEDILIYEHRPWDAVDHISVADVIFMVDFSDYGRIDDLADSIEVSNALKIAIDHHREPKEIADFMFVNHDCSSASEMVFEFLKIIDTDIIDTQIAEYLYMGIVSDTGSFMYDSANSKTFYAASELLKYNIDKTKIINGLFNNYPFNRLKFIGYLLDNKLEYIEKYNLAYIYVSNEDKEKFKYKPGDLENLVNMPLTISDIKFSILFLEAEKIVRVSMRSSGNIDVNKVSRKFFNGGGHKNAAGGRLDMSIEDALNYLNENIDSIYAEAVGEESKQWVKR